MKHFDIRYIFIPFALLFVGKNTIYAQGIFGGDNSAIWKIEKDTSTDGRSVLFALDSTWRELGGGGGGLGPQNPPPDTGGNPMNIPIDNSVWLLWLGSILYLSGKAYKKQKRKSISIKSNVRKL